MVQFNNPSLVRGLLYCLQFIRMSKDACFNVTGLPANVAEWAAIICFRWGNDVYVGKFQIVNPLYYSDVSQWGQESCILRWLPDSFISVMIQPFDLISWQIIIAVWAHSTLWHISFSSESSTLTSSLFPAIVTPELLSIFRPSKNTTYTPASITTQNPQGISTTGLLSSMESSVTTALRNTGSDPHHSSPAPTGSPYTSMRDLPQPTTTCCKKHFLFSQGWLKSIFTSQTSGCFWEEKFDFIQSI